MAGNSVVLTFIGEDGPLSRTMKKVEREADGLGRGLGGLTKSIFGIGAAGSAVQTVAALGTSLTQMAGAALLAPAGILAGAAAFATAKLAAQGFSDALGGDAEALAKLAPSARTTVAAVNALKPAWQGVQQVVQGNVFAGVADDVKQLGGSYIPVLHTGLGGIATGFNGMVRSAAAALKTPQAVGQVRAVLDATGSSVGRLRDSVGNLITGFLNLAGAGAQFIAGAGGGFTALTARFETWTQRITTDGSFQRWVTGAGQAFGQLFAVIRNLGSIVVTVITGLSGPTEGLFSSLERVTGMIRTFLESAQGQAALTALGTALRTVSAATSSILAAGLSQIGPLIQAAAPVVAELATAIGTALVTAIQIVGPLLTGFANFLSSVPGSATVLLGVLTALWAAFQVGAAVLTAARVAATLMAAWPTIVAVATGAWTAAQWLLNAALTANPIGIVIVVIAALVAGIIYAWNNCETFRSIVLAVWAAVQSAITTAVNVIKNVINWFGQLPGLISNWFNGAKTAAINAFTSLLSWLGALPGRILGALGQLGSLLVSVGRDLINGLWNGISAGWDWLTGKVKSLASGLLNAAKSALGIASPSTLFRDEIGKWIPEGVAVGITANTGSLIAAARTMTDTIKAGASDGLGNMVKLGQVSASTWKQLLAAGWKGKAGDGMEALYRPPSGGNLVRAEDGSLVAPSYWSQASPATSAPQPRKFEMTFPGNTSDALATVIMQMVRTGKIQIKAA